MAQILKSTEITIGNYYICNKKYNFIDNDGNKILMWSDRDFIDLAKSKIMLHQIKGWPLTQNTLKTIGFERDKKSELFILTAKGKLPELSIANINSDAEPLCSVMIKSVFINEYTITKKLFRYVHEIQNLIRSISETDVEIDLKLR